MHQSDYPEIQHPATAAGRVLFSGSSTISMRSKRTENAVSAAMPVSELLVKVLSSSGVFLMMLWPPMKLATNGFAGFIENGLW